MLKSIHRRPIAPKPEPVMFTLTPREEDILDCVSVGQTNKETANTLTGIMVEVVEEGTGTRARIGGVDVAGKTGTGEVEGKPPDAWFIGFAPAYDPKVAVAVLVEQGGEGGVVAAPIARRVIEEALSL